jgi:uncharacterized membrane protein YtjA (UPF0391 family)
MLKWAIGFVVLGLIAGLLAVSGTSGVWTFIALAAFFVLLLNGVMLLVVRERRKREVLT